MALPGALMGLVAGALCAALIIGTGGLGAIAIGAALATAGGLGMAGECIGKTIQGPPCGAIMVGSPNVLINGRPAARAVLSLGSCAKEYGVPQPEATGASTVSINGMPAGRVSEKLACSAVIISGSPNVLIGGASGQVLPLIPEVPAWLDNTMLAMAVGGTLIATGGIAFAYGIGPAIGTFVGGLAGGHYGGEGGQWLARQMGAGETGQAIGQVVGGFVGGMLGGGVGFRGGRFMGNRLKPPAPPSTSPNPASILNNGRINHQDVVNWANKNNLSDQWQPSTKFGSGGYKYQSSDGTHNFSIHGHGANPSAPLGSNAASGPTTSITRTPIGGGSRENLLSSGQWGPFKGNENSAHIPLDNSPY